ncbi:hypothetical protein GWN63_06095 [Candidatus Bathyarchaeota archaeon]|nr:hypothetical protein [Candidatus Bathyarchaeota archaeon]
MRGDLKIASIFLLGKRPEVLSRDKTEQGGQTDEVLQRYRLSKELKFLIREDDDLLRINIHQVDAFVIFPYILERFSPLIYLAETSRPIIIVSEENTFQHALETYDYLSDRQNVQLAFSPREVETKIRAVETTRWLENYRICLFDAGDWTLDGIAWCRNPLFRGKLNTRHVEIDEFIETCKNISKRQAESMAQRWMEEAEVLEPKLEDVTKTAQIYLAMKTTMQKMDANAAYLLWCAQFAEHLPKMCFALAKLADDGYPVGCWRGGNLLPMLILHSVSKRPVFTGEAFTRKGRTISLRHCFAPGSIGPCSYKMRNWRTTKGTVTGYCQLPKGRVTLINCGVGDEIVITRGKVIDCKDLGGKNCRITIWIELEAEEAIHKFMAREFAMIYGDYKNEAQEAAMSLGLRVL